MEHIYQISLVISFTYEVTFQRLPAISAFHGYRFNPFYNFYLAMLLISFCKAPPLRLTKTFSLYE